MKKTIFAVFTLLIMAAMCVPAFAQDVQSPVQEQAVPDAPAAEPAAQAAPVKKKASKKKTVDKAPAQESAAVTRAPVEQAPAPAAVVQAASEPQVETAPAVQAVVGTPAAPVAPAAARPQSCPNCFQPLLAGYNEIIADLKLWMDEMAAQATDLDRRLSEIQKRIDEKDDAIEATKTAADKKAVKAAVKVLNKERKLVLKEYTNTNDERDAFYKKFSKEAGEKVEGYNEITAGKLQMTLSAASQ